MDETIYRIISDDFDGDLQLTTEFLDRFPGRSFLSDEAIDPVTFFAPTNQAWINFLVGLGLADIDDFTGDLSDFEVIAAAEEAFDDLVTLSVRFAQGLGEIDQIELAFVDRLLGYHVVEGQIEPSALSDGAVFATTSGDTFRVDEESLLHNETVSGFPNPGAPAELFGEATNGRVYEIDEVLVPGAIFQLPAEDAGAPVTIRETFALVTGTETGDDARLSKGDDFMLGLDGADTMRGREGDDGINGGDGDDEIRGGRGDDNLHGGLGADLLKGGKGDDFIIDTFFVDLFTELPAVDTLEGGRGQDTLYSVTGERLDGGRGGDLLLNLAQSDVLLKGGRGSDYIAALGADADARGGRGADTLLSFLQDETLSGGRGEDVFVIDFRLPGFGLSLDRYATIADFNPKKDTIVFSIAGLDGVSSADLEAVQGLNDPDVLEFSDLLAANLLSATLSEQDDDLLVTFGVQSALLIQGLESDTSLEAFNALVEIDAEDLITQRAFNFIDD